MTTLQTLYDFIQNQENKKIIESNNLNPKPIITYYLSTNESYANGYYYLGGQIKLKPDDIISKEHIILIQNKNKELKQTDCVNYWEYCSCMNHEHTFNNFVKMFDFFEFYKKNSHLIS